MKKSLKQLKLGKRGLLAFAVFAIVAVVAPLSAYEINLDDVRAKRQGEVADEEVQDINEAFEDIETVPTACRGRVIARFQKWLASECEAKVVCDPTPPKLCPKKVCWTGTTWETRKVSRPYTVTHRENYWDYNSYQQQGNYEVTTFTPHTSTRYETVNTPGHYVKTRCGCSYQPGSSYTQQVDVTSWSSHTKTVPYSYTVTVATPKTRVYTTTEYETFCQKVPVEKEYCKVVMVPCE